MEFQRTLMRLKLEYPVMNGVGVCTRPDSYNLHPDHDHTPHRRFLDLRYTLSMNPPLRVIDGNKSGIFDGFILEVFGVSGLADSQRLSLPMIEKIGVAAAGDDWLFLVKTRKSGFSIAISAEKKSEWEALVREVANALPATK